VITETSDIQAAIFAWLDMREFQLEPSFSEVPVGLPVERVHNLIDFGDDLLPVLLARFMPSMPIKNSLYNLKDL
jgi:hypothetical protein